MTEVSNILDEYARVYFGEDEQQQQKFTPKHDLKNPPGVVGEVVNYINSQCRFPMEHLAVLASIIAVGNVGGLSHAIDNDGLTSNILGFGIAGSSSGKESVIQAFNDIHIATGLSGAVHGMIKSEQEIVRNLIRHQPSYYNIDEMGIFLRKLNLSQMAGGASYLQGVIGMIMSAYSKASGNLLLSGDLRDEIKMELRRELKKCEDARRVDEIERTLKGIDCGLVQPFLSMLGISTPSTFNESVSFEQVTNGFIGRAIIVNEPDTNPRPKRGFKKPPMPSNLRYALIGLRATGDYSVTDRRVESQGDKSFIKTTKDAQQALDDASDWIFDKAEEHVEQTGFEAVVRRGFEMIEKVSFILSMGRSERDLEAVEWSIEFVKRDIEYKTTLAYANVKEKSDPVKSMAAKILCSLGEDGMSIGKIVNRYRTKVELVEKAIDFLEQDGSITKKYVDAKYRADKVLKVFKA